MIDLILTLDYELPQNRRPDVRRYMLAPTHALLEACAGCGAKVTIMAEMAEVWAWENAANREFRKDLGYDAAALVREQLIGAVRSGHDVQLHLHPQWLAARWSGGNWRLDFSRYRLPLLDPGDLAGLLRRGKRDLEGMLAPLGADYACLGFRAGNWMTQPSAPYLRALQAAGLASETSVFKWGYIQTPSVFLDYRQACSPIYPWYADGDINRAAAEGILEMPIYAEPARIWGLFSLKRLWLASRYFLEDRMIARAVRGPLGAASSNGGRRPGKVSRFWRVYPRKFDFAKLTAREMMAMVEKILRAYDPPEEAGSLPVVAMGHSKEIGRCSEIRRFLEEATQRFPAALRFVTYREAVRAVQRKWGGMHHGYGSAAGKKIPESPGARRGLPRGPHRPGDPYQPALRGDLAP